MDSREFRKTSTDIEYSGCPVVLEGIVIVSPTDVGRGFLELQGWSAAVQAIVGLSVTIVSSEIRGAGNATTESLSLRFVGCAGLVQGS